MRSKRNKRLKITRGERFLYVTASLLVVTSFIMSFFFGANIGNLKMSVERIEADILTEEKKLESLTMKKNELTSFDKMKDIAKEMGLGYNNDNIVIIND